MTEAQADHYKTLGVARDATPEQIKAAYRRKASAYHPDRGEPGEKEDRQQAMAAVNAANDVLSDPERRRHYDETGASERPLSPEEALQREAQADLAQLLRQILSDEHAGDPIRLAWERIAEGNDKGRSHIANLTAKVKRLTAKRELVRRKSGGENLVHAIIDGEVQQASRDLATVQRALEVGKAMGRILDDYEYTGVKAPPGGIDTRDPMPFDFFLGLPGAKRFRR